MQKRLLIAILGATAVLTLVACGGKKSGPPARLQPTFVINSGTGATGAGGATGASGTATGAGATGSPTSGGADSSQLAGIADGFSKVKSYRATYILESAGAPAQEGKMEVVAPDKQHMTFSGFEMIKIGSDTYVKAGPSWIKSPAAGQTSPGFDVEGVSRGVSNLSGAGVVKGSTASVNGKTCQLYTSTSATGSQETCIADNLPLRIVSQSGGVKTTITFSDYNANIEIKAPI